jgi:phosphoesterase RecJ-like protein
MSAAADRANLVEVLLKARSALIFSHVNPDADAYGSACGLAIGLENMGLAVSLFNESGFVPRYAAIPRAAQVSAAIPTVASSEALVIICDCGAVERVGDAVLPFIRSAPLTVNIDHHNANSRFGTINYVVEGASSTSELVYDVLRDVEQSTTRSDIISRDAASCLLAGIIGDTGSFRYPSTAASTFLAAHDLVVRGARPDVLTQELFANQSLSAVRLQAEAMTGVQLSHNGAFAEVVVTQAMLKRLGADLLDADSLAERCRDIAGVTVSALFKEDVDMWRVSLRSRKGAVDVSAIAQSFGGGGHKPAAAFRWRRDFETLRSELSEKVGAALALERNSGLDA